MGSTRIKEAELNRIYEAIKGRLGSDEQQPNDIEAVAEIVHQLMGALTIYLNIECPERARAVRWMESRKRMRDASKN